MMGSCKNQQKFVYLVNIKIIFIVFICLFVCVCNITLQKHNMTSGLSLVNQGWLIPLIKKKKKKRVGRQHLLGQKTATPICPMLSLNNFLIEWNEPLIILAYNILPYVAATKEK